MEADGGAGYEETVVLLGELIGCVYHDVTPVWKHAHSMRIDCMGLLVAGTISQTYFSHTAKEPKPFPGQIAYQFLTARLSLWGLHQVCTSHEREGVCKHLLQMRALSSEQNSTAGLSWQMSHCTGSAALSSFTLSCFAASLLAPCTL